MMKIARCALIRVSHRTRNQPYGATEITCPHAKFSSKAVRNFGLAVSVDTILKQCLKISSLVEGALIAQIRNCATMKNAGLVLVRVSHPIILRNIGLCAMKHCHVMCFRLVWKSVGSIVATVNTSL